MSCKINLPGDSKTIENTIKPKTAAMTNSAMNIPRQFLWLGDEATNSYNDTIEKRNKINSSDW